MGTSNSTVNDTSMTGVVGKLVIIWGREHQLVVELILKEGRGDILLTLISML